MSVKKILILDDEEKLLRIIRMGIESKKYDVQTATSASKALKIIYHEPIDLIVTDVKMPGMSGIELVYELERLEMGIPIIVMTAFGDVGTVVKLFKHGAVDYLQKPFSVDELERCIGEALEKSEAIIAEKKGQLPGLQEGIEAREKELIRLALLQTGNNKAKAAKLLAVSERTLWYKVKKYRL